MTKNIIKKVVSVGMITTILATTSIGLTGCTDAERVSENVSYYSYN